MIGSGSAGLQGSRWQTEWLGRRGSWGQAAAGWDCAWEQRLNSVGRARSPHNNGLSEQAALLLDCTLNDSTPALQQAPSAPLKAQPLALTRALLAQAAAARGLPFVRRTL